MIRANTRTHAHTHTHIPILRPKREREQMNEKQSERDTQKECQRERERERVATKKKDKNVELSVIYSKIVCMWLYSVVVIFTLVHGLAVYSALIRSYSEPYGLETYGIQANTCMS